MYKSQGQWTNSHSIIVIGLDEHKQEVHTGQNKNYQFSSSAKSYQVLHAGECDSNELDHVWSNFEKSFREGGERTGFLRSAAGGRQGHQRTPAFIHAVLIDVLNNKNGTLPLGCCTDVGLHTGGDRRDTHFALVRSVYKWILDQVPRRKNSNFEVVHLLFDMFLAREAFFGPGGTSVEPGQSQGTTKYGGFHK